MIELGRLFFKLARAERLAGECRAGGNLGDARAARLNLRQNPKLVMVRPDTAALDARQNLNPPHNFTLGYVAT